VRRVGGLKLRAVTHATNDPSEPRSFVRWFVLEKLRTLRTLRTIPMIAALLVFAFSPDQRTIDRRPVRTDKVPRYRG
jgi:hypothetical protein